MVIYISLGGKVTRNRIVVHVEELKIVIFSLRKEDFQELNHRVCDGVIDTYRL